MPSNQDALDQCLSKGKLDFEAFATKLESTRNNGLIDDDTGQLLASLSVYLGTKLEALQLLKNEIEAIRRDT